MSRKSVMEGDSAPLEELVADVVFRPQEEHRRLKSRFLAKIADNPLIDVETVSLDEVRRIVGGTQISKFWNQPGFREWFLNTGEYQERLETLFSLALDAAQDILLNQDPKGQSARAAMVKTMAELAGKLRPPKEKTPDMSEAMKKLVAGMDMAQLSVFLEKNGQTLSLEASKGQSSLPPEITVDKSN